MARTSTVAKQQEPRARPAARPRPAALKRANDLFALDAPPPRTTKERLVEAAMELFYLQGFHAVGLDQILSEVGISKQAFYKHFESKDDLAIAAILYRDEWEGVTFRKQVRERVPGGEPAATMLAMFDVLDMWFTHPDYHGCLFITACMEFPSPNDPIHRAARLHFENNEAAISELGKAAGVDDPAELARELLALLEGAVTQRISTGDHTAARRMRRVAQLAIASRQAARIAGLV
jgi:AcrR family transcriptional regulator